MPKHNIPSPPIGIPADFGDRICEALERRHGPVEIILIVAKADTNWKQPEVICSVHPDIMEAVIKQMAEQLDSGALGKRYSSR